MEGVTNYRANDQLDDGCGALGMLPPLQGRGAHEYVSDFFRWQSEQGDGRLGPDGAGWPREDVLAPNGHGLVMYPPAVRRRYRTQEGALLSNAAPQGVWPRPLLARLATGDAIIAMHSVPHCSTRVDPRRDGFGPTGGARVQVYFRCVHGGRPQSAYSVWPPALMNCWLEWEGLQHIAARQLSPLRPEWQADQTVSFHHGSSTFDSATEQLLTDLHRFFVGAQGPNQVVVLDVTQMKHGVERQRFEERHLSARMDRRVYAGVRRDLVPTICRTGSQEVRISRGWFGSGIYSTTSPAYAARYALRTEDGTFIMLNSKHAVGKIGAILVSRAAATRPHYLDPKCDFDEALQCKWLASIKPGHDAHVARVVQRPNEPDGNFYICEDHEINSVDEIMVATEQQLLLEYVVIFRVDEAEAALG